MKHNGIALISKYLDHQNLEISINALSTLIYLITDENLPVITTPVIISKALQYSASTNKRMKNIGDIFLSDFCTAEQIKHAKTLLA